MQIRQTSEEHFTTLYSLTYFCSLLHFLFNIIMKVIKITFACILLYMFSRLIVMHLPTSLLPWVKVVFHKYDFISCIYMLIKTLINFSVIIRKKYIWQYICIYYVAVIKYEHIYYQWFGDCLQFWLH